MEPSGHGAGAIRAWAVCWAQPHQQLGDEVRQEAPPALNAQQANHGAGDDGNEGATASTGRTAQIMPCSVEQRFALIHPTYKYPRTPMLCRRVSGLTASSCGLFFAAMGLHCSRGGASAPAIAPAFPRETVLARYKAANLCCLGNEQLCKPSAVRFALRRCSPPTPQYHNPLTPGNGRCALGRYITTFKPGLNLALLPERGAFLSCSRQPCVPRLAGLRVKACQHACIPSDREEERTLVVAAEQQKSIQA